METNAWLYGGNVMLYVYIMRDFVSSLILNELHDHIESLEHIAHFLEQQ